MRLLSIKLPIIYEFLICFCVVILIRGTAIFSVTWAQDDFLQLFDPSAEGFIAVHISMLRPSVALITGLVRWLGATFPTNGSMWSGLHAGALVVFGLALRRLWIPAAPSIYGIMTALIFSLFPGLNNLWQYQVIHPAMTVFYCLAAFALFSYNKGGWLHFLSIMAIGITLSYQVFLSMFLVAVLVLLGIKANSYFTFENQQSHPSFRALLAPVLALAGCVVAGVVVYLLTSKLALSWSGFGQSSRTSLAGWDMLPGKASQLMADMKRLIYGNGEVYLPYNIKLIQSLLLALILISSIVIPQRKWLHWPRAASHFGAVSLILIAAAIAIRIPTIFFAYTPDNPRVLIGTAVFWSGIFAMAIDTGPKFLKRLSLIVGALLFCAYAIITNSVCSDFVRLNQRELLLASRIVERLAQLPEYNRLRTVVVVGSSPQIVRDFRGMDLIWSGLNSSMGTGVLREASGEDLQSPSPADQEIATRLSQQMQVWPSKGSTGIVGDVGVVVLSKPF